MTRIYLPQALSAWQTPEFKTVLKAELEALDRALLPLQQGLRQSSHANPDSVEAVVISVEETEERIGVKVMLFYTGIIAGCSCADDPTPVDEINEQCQLRVDIRKDSGDASLTLLDD